MSVSALLSTVRAQLKLVPWLHTVREPATCDQIDKLPVGLRGLYEATDGLGIHHLKFQNEIVGTGLEVLRAVEICPIDIAMYGSSSNTSRWRGNQWLAVVRGSDAAFFVALDPITNTYYEVSPIAPDEAEAIASSSQEFFEWLLHKLPTEDQVAWAQQQSAA